MRHLAICMGILFLASCGGARRKAVEQALEDHLKQDTHLVTGSYETKIERVTASGDTAEALARFDSKQSARVFVEVSYRLRLENGRWEVISSTPVRGLGGDSERPRDSNLPTPLGQQPGITPHPSH
jgi:hypothetical protein